MRMGCVAEVARAERSFVLVASMVILLTAPAWAKTVVFWQPGFPTVDSQPVERISLEKALDGMDAQFADIRSLNEPATLANTELLILPYGSSFPVDGWKAIEEYLHAGGNMLIVGGQPLRVPVAEENGKFVESAAQDTYARALDFRHTYEVPVPSDAQFAWKFGYDFAQKPQIHAHRFFAVEGHLDGLGFMKNKVGELTAAPVIVADRTSNSMPGCRIVALDFDPQSDYWKSQDGIALIRQSAQYASQGATQFTIETFFSALRVGESPLITAHLRNQRQGRLGNPVSGEVKLTLSSENGTLDSATLPVSYRGSADVTVPFQRPLQPGFYKVAATYSEGGQLREFYLNGFWVEDTKTLDSGPVLGAHADFLTRDGAPFFPVGVNYFTTEENGWDFPGPRNAWIWEKDFDDMSRHGVSFVRTGVWMPDSRPVDGSTGGVSERFLRNLEAFLRCAQRHNIAVNFTFYAFTPYAKNLDREDPKAVLPDPYIDPASIQAQQSYIRSIVERFKDVPWLSWDLINEPSFSNPRFIFKGNYPNGDPAEIEAWHEWLRKQYGGNLAKLASDWRIPADQIASFDDAPLPSVAELTFQRYGNPNQVRAVDYNLFAQETFGNWVRSMVTLIRATGSKQLIDVGQDEGGVTDRALNQFYADAGVSFTTNHTYWQDDALLWDSVAAKRPGMPNITGETGYQPVWAPDGVWRYDEFTGLDLIERKWALGFAAGSSGALQWDWAREVDFGMQRSDGSAKVWENRMRELGEFARKAAPLATALLQPDVAIVLPLSYQMSVYNVLAIEAQQKAVRALYGYARSQAYAVGEHQTALLGLPKLIILPSPYVLNESAWQDIEGRVKAGAILLVTGPFDGDAHFHATERQSAVGLPYRTEPLTIREFLMHFPGGEERLIFSGGHTTVLSRAVLANNDDWIEVPLGRGKILFSPLPLEMNDNLQALGDVYRYALKVADVAPVYTTTLKDPEILICPTRFPSVTLYVITSESNQQEVNFEDMRSGSRFVGTLTSGRAAILLIGADGKLLSAYNWVSQ